MSKQTWLVCVLVVGVLGTQYAMAQYPDVLGWWPLNEGEGNVAVDISGNGNDGTLEGTPDWIDDPDRGMVLSFGGGGDHVDTPVTIPAMTLENAFTWVFWCMQVGDGGGVNNVVLGNRYGGTAAPLQFIKFTPTNFEYYYDAHNGTIAYENIPNDEWVHMATVKDGASLTHYRNGVEAGSNTTTVEIDENPFSMGGDATNGAEYWTGSLSDVALFTGALTESQIQDIMAGKGLTPELPTVPMPADAAVDVRPDTMLSWIPGAYAASHDVYLGTDFTEVSEATPADAAYMGNELEASYDPEHLVLGQTYYWRIDEVNAAPDNTVFKGPTWSFEVEPVSYAIPIGAVTATASSMDGTQGPENTVNGSGLNDNDEHSVQIGDMWAGASTDVTSWIQFEFEKLQKLDKVHVWNHNTQTEVFLGFGIKEALIEYSTDGETWMEFGTVELAQAPGKAGYTGEAIPLNGIMAKSVKLTGLSNYSMLGLPQKGLSEVRFYVIPVQAREPMPADGSTSDGVDITLQWRSGREAVEHEVVFSTDEQAVIDGSAVVATVSETAHDLGTLDLGTSYFWKINEMNDLGTPPAYVGDLWTFQTPDHLMIDDFEMYKAEEGLRIWEYWFDGFTNQAENGAVVGNGDDAEKSVVYEGRQSMPIAFNNTLAPKSEVTRFFDTAMDLSKGKAESLKLQVIGDPNNGAAPMYVVLADTAGKEKTFDHPDPAATVITSWNEWMIPLADLSPVDVTKIDSIIVGVGSSGVQGKVYVDAIRTE